MAFELAPRVQNEDSSGPIEGIIDSAQEFWALPWVPEKITGFAVIAFFIWLGNKIRVAIIDNPDLKEKK